MRINKKLLGFGTLALPVVVAASMFFAMNPNTNLLNKVQADDVSGSIEFSTTAGTRTLPGNKVITTSGRTTGGFQLYSYAVDNSLTNITSSTIANTCQTYGYIYFSESNTELKHFKFQGVNSITITTLEYSLKNVEIAKSTDGETFTVEQSTSGYFTSKTFNVSGLRYLRIKVSNNSAYDYIEVTKIVLGYNCSTSYSGDALKTISVVDPITEYAEGGEFVAPKVVATYEDDTSKTVTNFASFTGYDLSTPGNQTVNVSYSENGITKTTNYGITVLGGESDLISPGTYTSGNYKIVLNENGRGTFGESDYYNMIGFNWEESANGLEFTFDAESTIENVNNRKYAPFWDSSVNYTASKVCTINSSDNFSVLMYRSFGSISSTTVTFTK